MKFKSVQAAFIAAILSMSGLANAVLITKDYSVLGDGLLTVDTIAKKEWLDVTIFYGMNLSTLQGTNQWTNVGFHLASDIELLQLFVNIGSTFVTDGTGTLGYGSSHTAKSITAVNELHVVFSNNYITGTGAIFGILAPNITGGAYDLGRFEDGANAAVADHSMDNYGNAGGGRVMNPMTSWEHFSFETLLRYPSHLR